MVLEGGCGEWGAGDGAAGDGAAGWVSVVGRGDRRARKTRRIADAKFRASVSKSLQKLKNLPLYSPIPLSFS